MFCSALLSLTSKTATGGVLLKKVLLKILQIPQVLSCEIRKNFKNTYFEEHLLTTASVNLCKPCGER